MKIKLRMEEEARLRAQEELDDVRGGQVIKKTRDGMALTHGQQNPKYA